MSAAVYELEVIFKFWVWLPLIAVRSYGCLNAAMAATILLELPGVQVGLIGFALESIR
jgi:hypothetical protein